MRFELFSVAFLFFVLVPYSAALINYNFTQTLDHFNISDERTFTQRTQFFSNYYQKGGPIILVVGAERAIDPQYEIYVSSVFSFFAPALHAFILATEHRYYGESLPFGQTSDTFSLSGLQYLTINQSLADNAAIIKWLKFTSQYSSLFSPSTPVITVGGSYGGFLSALMRIQYPEIVTAAIASCTVPYLWALPNQGALWFELVSQSYLTLWPNISCYQNLDAEFATLLEAVNSGNTSALQQSLNLCEAPIVATYWKLSEFIKTAFTNIVEFNYPKREVFCIANPFDELCSFVDINNATTNDWPGILHALQLYYNASGSLQCFEWLSNSFTLPSGCSAASRSSSTHSYYKELTMPQTEPTYSPWSYQSCTEFIYGAAGGVGFFHYGFNWSLTSAKSSCQVEIPGSTFSPYSPLIWPSLAPDFTNVIFSSAGFDPNRGWSINETLSDTVIEVYMPSSAHTSDISNFGTATTPELNNTMHIELSYVLKWINGNKSTD